MKATFWGIGLLIIPLCAMPGPFPVASDLTPGKTGAVDVDLGKGKRESSAASPAESSERREPASNRSVICVAPTGSFRPNTGADLFSELNRLLSFEIQADEFVCKPKAGRLVGWIVVSGEARKEAVKRILGSSDRLRVLQVEPWTTELAAVFRDNWKASRSVTLSEGNREKLEPRQP